MDYIKTFAGDARDSIMLLAYLWPAIFLIVLGLLGLIATLMIGPNDRFKRRFLWMLTQFVFPATILFVGVLFPWDGPFDFNASSWPVYLLDAIGLAHLTTVAFLVYWRREARLQMLFMSLIVLAFSLSTEIVSGMRVTGDYI